MNFFEDLMAFVRLVVILAWFVIGASVVIGLLTT